MEALWILLVGVVIVVGGVLLLRLHAFLALTLGALAVALLTPTENVERYEIEKAAVKILAIDAVGSTIELALSEKQGASADTILHLLRPTPEGGSLEKIASLQFVELLDDGRSRWRISNATDLAKVQPDDVVVHPLKRIAAAAVARKTIGARVATGFGNTCVKIGILIAMASIIGKCLLDSGAADRIVRTMLGLLGERGAPLAFTGSGFLLGIPVFFDTVFYLLIPLGKAMRMRTGRNYLLYVLTIVCGATMAHSLVPPTPGPLFVAEQLGVDLGVMILAGCIVGFFPVAFGFLYAHWASRRWELPLRESAELSLEDLEKLSSRDESELPPFWLSLLPILLPVVLIAGYTILKMLVKQYGVGIPAGVMRVAETLGDKNIALVISAAVAMGMLSWQKRSSLKQLAPALGNSLASGGVIILITAAGGAFGGVLQQTGVSSLIRDLPDYSPLVILLLAFGITAAVRTAQGSATVAMITAVGILSGIAGDLSFHPVYLALAVGCGSKPIAWMNDSGFWVICKMSGMSEAEGLKYVTPMTTCMGIVGLAATMVGATLFPMTP